MTRAYRKLPVEDVLAAIKAHKGNVSYIAEQFDVPRSVIYLKIRSKPTLTQAMIDIKEGWKDKAESNIAELLESGDYRATVLVLTMLCRDRGWALPKNGVFGDGDPGKIDAITVQAITINTYEHNTFAPEGTQGVKIEAVPPPQEPAASDEADTLLIEGELAQEPEGE
jgi:hypothetical protein